MVSDHRQQQPPPERIAMDALRQRMDVLLTHRSVIDGDSHLLAAGVVQRWLDETYGVLSDLGLADEIERLSSLTWGEPPGQRAILAHQFLQTLSDQINKDPQIAVRGAAKRARSAPPPPVAKRGDRVFIGHGRSLVWHQLRDLLRDRLHLQWEEYNRTPTAGYARTERLTEMLDSAAFAFVVLTAEDEHADSTIHARENVIHEAGLFQGSLGFRRAIVLLEEDCAEFSNIAGLEQIRFPKGNIDAKSEEIRRVLERERIIPPK